MSTFEQHFPAYVERREPPTIYHYETVEQLLSLEVVQKYIGPTHSHFACETLCGHNMLMEVADKGAKWWVVGYISDTLTLPKWECPWRTPIPEPPQET